MQCHLFSVYLGNKSRPSLFPACLLEQVFYAVIRLYAKTGLVPPARTFRRTVSFTGEGSFTWNYVKLSRSRTFLTSFLWEIKLISSNKQWEPAQSGDATQKMQMTLESLQLRKMALRVHYLARNNLKNSGLSFQLLKTFAVNYLITRKTVYYLIWHWLCGFSHKWCSCVKF